MTAYPTDDRVRPRTEGSTHQTEKESQARIISWERSRERLKSGLLYNDQTIGSDLDAIFSDDVDGNDSSQ